MLRHTSQMNKIPDWLARLPDNGYINAVEIHSLVPHLSPQMTIKILIKYGHIPEPSHRFGKNGKCHWKVKDIRRWLREKV